jgi:beta-phosphoglucomutase-like phosphatase (HAD superfamily)
MAAMNRLNLHDFEAVAWDFEGTLADTIPTHHIARTQAFDIHGYGHITPEQHALGPIYGSSTADIVGGVLHAAGEIEKTGPFTDHPSVRPVMETKLKIFEGLAADGFNEMPGATDFVKEVASQFVGKTALVTSSPERFIGPFFERYDIGRFFPPELVISHDTIVETGLNGKPAADPYELAMQRLNTRKLLVFEDTVSGVVSAKRAGATVVALGFEVENAKLFATELEYPPDFVVRDYTEARVLLGLNTQTA